MQIDSYSSLKTLDGTCLSIIYYVDSRLTKNLLTLQHPFWRLFEYYTYILIIQLGKKWFNKTLCMEQNYLITGGVGGAGLDPLSWKTDTMCKSKIDHAPLFYLNIHLNINQWKVLSRSNFPWGSVREVCLATPTHLPRLPPPKYSKIIIFTKF